MQYCACQITSLVMPGKGLISYSDNEKFLELGLGLGISPKIPGISPKIPPKTACDYIIYTCK